MTGTPAPDFDLEGTDGKRWTLRKLHGHKVVLIFYLLDQTPV